MTCKGVCVRHKASKPKGIGRYASGQRRCQICEIYIKWEGLWCPCCGYRLRNKPRNITYKQKLRETIFKSGAHVKIFKDWRNCEGFEFSAILVELTESYCKGGGAEWSIRRLDDFKKNPECPTEKRIINIEKKITDENGKVHYVVLDEI